MKTELSKDECALEEKTSKEKEEEKGKSQKKKTRKNFFKTALKNICLSPVYFFKFCISPLLPHCCIFVPTCSNYMILAVKEFGVFKGFWIGTKRLFRCVPWQKKRGYDPVPINMKGEHIWIL